jgi:hypothetical protein
MAKVFACDACGCMVEDPYEAKMKEFYIGVSFEMDGAFPVRRRRKEIVHLCEECYHGLQAIAKKKVQNDIV